MGRAALFFYKRQLEKVGRYLDTDSGANRIRALLVLLASVYWLHPFPPNEDGYLFAAATCGALRLGNVLLLLFIVPGLLTLATYVMAALAWLLPIMDATLFFVPRNLIRYRLRWPAMVAFICAFGLEIAALGAASRWLARSFRPCPSAAAGAGLHLNKPAHRAFAAVAANCQRRR